MFFFSLNWWFWFIIYKMTTIFSRKTLSGLGDKLFRVVPLSAVINGAKRSIVIDSYIECEYDVRPFRNIYGDHCRKVYAPVEPKSHERSKVTLRIYIPIKCASVRIRVIVKEMNQKRHDLCYEYTDVKPGHFDCTLFSNPD